MKVEYEFESKIPVEHVKHLIALFQSGEAAGKKGQVLKEAGSCLGELGALVSSFEVPHIFGASDEPQSLEELSTELSASLPADGAMYGAALNPETVKKIIKFILLLVQTLG